MSWQVVWKDEVEVKALGMRAKVLIGDEWQRAQVRSGRRNG